jgi:multidrug efflux pump subunit AcrB
VRVYVRRPREERSSEADIERFLVRTASNGEMPLTVSATMERGRAYTEVERRNGRRIIHVTADLDTTRVTSNEVVAGVQQRELKQLASQYPGLSFDFGAGQRGQQETAGSLGMGFLIALGGIYVMLAIALGSYIVKPVPVMLAIPFGWTGAILGHVIMGYTLSLISVMGMIALTGVVVNSSLVLIDGANELQKSEGLSSGDAIRQSALRRFRPIMLTSATTFLGLLPMLSETSAQARFLIPMAISLAFGIFFSTALSLLVVPAGFLLLDELSEFFARVWRNVMGLPADEWPSEAGKPVDYVNSKAAE